MKTVKKISNGVNKKQKLFLLVVFLFTSSLFLRVLVTRAQYDDSDYGSSYSYSDSSNDAYPVYSEPAPAQDTYSQDFPYDAGIGAQPDNSVQPYDSSWQPPAPAQNTYSQDFPYDAGIGAQPDIPVQPYGDGQSYTQEQRQEMLQQAAGAGAFGSGSPSSSSAATPLFDNPSSQQYNQPNPTFTPEDYNTYQLTPEQQANRDLIDPNSKYELDPNGSIMQTNNDTSNYLNSGGSNVSSGSSTSSSGGSSSSSSSGGSSSDGSSSTGSSSNPYAAAGAYANNNGFYSTYNTNASSKSSSGSSSIFGSILNSVGSALGLKPTTATRQVMVNPSTGQMMYTTSSSGSSSILGSVLNSVGGALGLTSTNTTSQIVNNPYAAAGNYANNNGFYPSTAGGYGTSSYPSVSSGNGSIYSPSSLGGDYSSLGSLGSSGLGSLGSSSLGSLGSYGSLGSSGSYGSGLQMPQNTGLPQNSNGVVGVLSNVLMWLLAIVGTLSVIAFVVAGIQYLVSAGNEKDMETAKRSLTYAIIGVVVALAGLIILTTITSVLGGTAPSASGGSTMGY